MSIDEPADRSKPLVLIADDDENVRLVLGLRLRRSGFTVVEAADVGEGLKAADEHDPGFVVLDVHLPGLDDGALTRLLTAKDGHRRVLFLSAQGTDAAGDAVLEPVALDCLDAPLDDAELLARLRRPPR